MNAMTGAVEALPVGAYRPPRRDDYEAIVRAMVPHCEGEVLILRSSLLFLRDRAVATKPIASESGWALLDIIEREASQVAFRSIPLDDLREIRRLCVRCVMTASGFDMLEQRTALKAKEEVDGRD